MENKNMELENQNTEAIAEKEPEKKGLGAKIVGGVKKHWKGVLLAFGAGVLGFIAGTRSVKAGTSEEVDDQTIEVDDYSVEDDA